MAGNAVSETYTCFLDGKSAGCGSGASGSKQYTGLAAGSHSFVLQGKATHNRPATTSPTSWVIDLTAPRAPSVDPYPTTSSTWASISFHDLDPVSGYRCALDNADPQVATDCPDPWPIAGPLATNTTHTAYVYALGTALPALMSTAVPMTWTIDSTKPAMPSLTQKPTAATTSASATFGWTSEAGSSSSCSLDGAAFVACGNDTSTTRSITYSDLAGNGHTFAVFDTDAAKNAGPAATWPWTIYLTPPPAPNVDNGPTNPTDSNSATFVFSDPQAGVSYLCKLDTASSFTICPASYSGLADGPHSLVVEAQDPALQVSAPSDPFKWTIDTSPTGTVALSPVYIYPLPFTSTSSPTVTFTLLALDNTTTTGFLCKVDQGPYTACGTPDASGLGSATVTVAEGQHVFSVEATDGTNTSPANPYAWTYDKTLPALSFSTTPAQPSNSTTALFTFATEAGASLTCSLDSGEADPCDSPKTIYNMAPGSHTFDVWATDAAGNQSHIFYGWTIDLSVPAAPVISGPSAYVASATAHFTWNAPATGVSDTCTVDNQPSQACDSADLTFNDLGQGMHTFAVAATNTGSGKTSIATRQWTVDTVAPVLQVGFPTDGALVASRDIAPSITETDTNPATYSCSLTGVVSATSCGQYTSLADGDYTLTVTGSDAAGNVATPVVVHWTVDGTPPPAASVNGPATTTNARPAFTFSDAESPVTFGCAVDGASFSTCTSPYTVPSTLGVGSHTFTVRTFDTAGNSSDSPFVFDVTVAAPIGAPGDTTPPTATVAVPTTLTGASTATFSETVRSLTAGGAALVVTGTTTVVPTTVACLSGGTVVNCGSNFTSLRVTPKSALVPGQHYTVRLLAGAVKDTAGNALTAKSVNFRASLSEQETSAAAKTTWSTLKTTKAYGGSLVREQVAGASATYTFTGTSITWWTLTGRDQGKATVYVDGVRKAVVNNYAAATHFKVARAFGKLANKRHTIRIVVNGVKGAKAATGTLVAVDAFTVGKTRTNSPALVTTWRPLGARQFSAGHASAAAMQGESLSFTFRGTSITWVTEKARNQGKVAVYIDGVRKAVLDNYATKTTFGVKRSLSRLTDKVHTLKLVVLGTHHKGATGTWVTVDRFMVA